MAYRKFFKLLMTKFSPVQPVLLYATTTFSYSEPPKDPNNEQKLLFEDTSTKKLTYDYLIKQSTVDAVNTASQALTVTYVAIEATSKEYRDLLTRLIVLMNETLLHKVDDAHWDEILEIRYQMQTKKQMLLKFIDYMDYVHKMAEAASEISFLAGLDNLSTSMTSRIDDALIRIQTEKSNNTQLEEEYVRIQEKTIENGKIQTEKSNKTQLEEEYVEVQEQSIEKAQNINDRQDES